MAYKSFNTRTRKLDKIWQQTELNAKIIKDSKEFEPIKAEEIIVHNNKLITKVIIRENETNNWFGSVKLENFTEQMLEFVYPVATFNFIDRNSSTKDLEIFEGSLYYWFNKINDNNYFLRFAIDSSVDTFESYALNFSLVFFNKRIYDNLQKSKQ